MIQIVWHTGLVLLIALKVKKIIEIKVRTNYQYSYYNAHLSMDYFMNEFYRSYILTI